MFKIEPTCSFCKKEIKGNDVVYVKMRYPMMRGMTEIRAYLQNEGEFICESCFEEQGGSVE